MAVAPEFFDFGMALLEKVAKAVTDGSIRDEGNSCMEMGRKLVKNDESIKKLFLDSSQSHPMEKKEKLTLLEMIIDKVCNARFGAVLRKYKDHETGRRGEKTSDLSLRGKLKAMEG